MARAGQARDVLLLFAPSDRSVHSAPPGGRSFRGLPRATKEQVRRSISSHTNCSKVTLKRVEPAAQLVSVSFAREVAPLSVANVRRWRAPMTPVSEISLERQGQIP